MLEPRTTTTLLQMSASTCCVVPNYVKFVVVGNNLSAAPSTPGGVIGS